MNQLTLDLIKLAFLAVLWLFVITAIGVVRTDLFDQPSSPRRQRKAARQQSHRTQQTGPIKLAKHTRAAPRMLLVTGGSLAGTTIQLAQQQITIGRAADATLVLTDDYASTRHARLFPQNGEWIVGDLGSTNGTYLDRQKVTQPTPVPTGVPVRIGKTVLELRK
jgi:pSer/pThr/pTyr-binding forkhead associated (FHA) protein